MLQPNPIDGLCPSCGSRRTWHDGIRHTLQGDVQRWLCRDCGHRFSETYQIESRRQFQPRGFVETKASYCPEALSLNSHIGAIRANGAKNMAQTTPLNNGLAGATTQTIDSKSKILEYAWWLKKNGKSDATIEGRTKLLRTLVKRGANLCDPETLKEVIAKQPWSNGRKNNACDAYSSFQEWSEDYGKLQPT
jgi:hypothetical protein